MAHAAGGEVWGVISAKMLNFFGEEEHLAHTYYTTSYDEYMYSYSTIFSGFANNMKQVAFRGFYMCQ